MIAIGFFKYLSRKKLNIRLNDQGVIYDADDKSSIYNDNLFYFVKNKLIFSKEMYFQALSDIVSSNLDVPKKDKENFKKALKFLDNFYKSFLKFDYKGGLVTNAKLKRIIVKRFCKKVEFEQSFNVDRNLVLYVSLLVFLRSFLRKVVFKSKKDLERLEYHPNFAPFGVFFNYKDYYFIKCD